MEHLLVSGTSIRVQLRGCCAQQLEFTRGIKYHHETVARGFACWLVIMIVYCYSCYLLLVVCDQACKSNKICQLFVLYEYWRYGYGTLAVDQQHVSLALAHPQSAKCGENKHASCRGSDRCVLHGGGYNTCIFIFTLKNSLQSFLICDALSLRAVFGLRVAILKTQPLICTRHI